MATEQADSNSRQTHRRKRAIAGLWFYVPTTLVTGVLLVRYPALGTAALFICALVGLWAALFGMRSRGQRRPSLAKQQPSAVQKSTIDVPGVGIASYDEDTSAWVVSSPHEWDIHLAGSVDAVDPALARSGVWFRTNREQFEHDIKIFLQMQEQDRQFKEWQEALDDIRSLRIEFVTLASPQRPNDGMIYFCGNESDRVWRCDMIDRKPRGLGFDD